MREHRVWSVYCPDSNLNLCSGTASVRTLLSEGNQVVLGSDIAGGAILPMYRVAGQAIRCSKIRSMLSDGKESFLTPSEAYYLSTSAGQLYFGEQTGFAAGNSFHAVVVDDSSRFGADCSPEQRLERFLYVGNENMISAVYANGREIKNKKLQ